MNGRRHPVTPHPLRGLIFLGASILVLGAVGVVTGLSKGDVIGLAGGTGLFLVGLVVVSLARVFCRCRACGLRLGVVSGDKGSACPECNAFHHDACREARGGCYAATCSESASARPAEERAAPPPSSPRRRREWRR